MLPRKTALKWRHRTPGESAPCFAFYTKLLSFFVFNLWICVVLYRWPPYFLSSLSLRNLKQVFTGSSSLRPSLGAWVAWPIIILTDSAKVNLTHLQTTPAFVQPIGFHLSLRDGSERTFLTMATLNLRQLTP